MGQLMDKIIMLVLVIIVNEVSEMVLATWTSMVMLHILFVIFAA